MPLRLFHGFAVLSAALSAAAALAQDAPKKLDDPTAANVGIDAHFLEPKQIKPTPERIGKLNLPKGFKIELFAEGLTNPRMMAAADNGSLYVTERATGALVMLQDLEGDGKAEVRKVVANRPMAHGVAIDGDTLYLVTVKDIYKATIQDNGSLSELQRIVSDLPDAGQHPNRTIVVGPDKKLYVSVGSTCNACPEPNPENATMLRVEPDGSSRTIFASGLRNTIGFGFEPMSGALYGMDHGIDWLGNEEQKEELNHIQQGKKYGWPYIYSDSRMNPHADPPNGLSMEEWARQSEEPVKFYTAHSAPMQMGFARGPGLPAAYAGDAFVAMRGSWNRMPPSGYEVVRIDFKDGKPKSIEPFITGFLTEDKGRWEQMGRFAGLAVSPKGEIFVSDDKNGVVYRVIYEGPEAWPETTASIDPPAPLPARKVFDELALQVLRGKTRNIAVRALSFADEAPIPLKHGAGAENISPALDWPEGPEGTKSYVVVMEDPDAKQNPPFVHWTMYNIPAEVRHLPEGVPTEPKLAVPTSALQGVNDRGSTGYFGPKPPVGDPPHHYHFQILALDTMLDLPHGASRDDILAAAEGHVLAKGRVVGTFRR